MAELDNLAAQQVKKQKHDHQTRAGDGRGGPLKMPL